MSLPGVIEGEHAQASSPPPRVADLPAAISVMSEPVLAAAETATATAASPSRGHQNEHRPAAVARPTPSPNAANSEGLAVDPSRLFRSCTASRRPSASTSSTRLPWSFLPARGAGTGTPRLQIRPSTMMALLSSRRARDPAVSAPGVGAVPPGPSRNPGRHRPQLGTT